MKPARDTIGPLPDFCPEKDCSTPLQRSISSPGAGVSPHYTYCHPGVAPPKVLPGVRLMDQPWPLGNHKEPE